MLSGFAEKSKLNNNNKALQLVQKESLKFHRAFENIHF